MSDNTSIFASANNKIIDDIKRELRLQGHYLTGALEQSFHQIIEFIDGQLSLSASAAEYLESLEHYTPPGRIQISNAEFDKLKKWVLLRDLASFDHEATMVAAAIIRKWKKEGRPTANSVTFSQTGSRTDAVATTFQQNEERYTKMIDEAVIRQLDEEFSNVQNGPL